MTLAEYLDRRPTDGASDSEVLIFDQFEEILTVDPANRAAKTAFFVQVGAALRNRRRWALFSMREDYVAALAPYVRYVPTRLDCTYHLDLLGVDGARQAIQRPARDQGVEFDDAATAQLIDDLRRIHVQRSDGSMEEQLGPSVEPVQLQVVCYRLWSKRFDGRASELPADGRRITAADIEAVGDVNRALSDYYAERVAAVATATGVSERAIREWFDRKLIRLQGIRGQVLQGEGQSEGLENRAIHALIDAYLVRAEKRRGATWFELAHDRLIEPVRKDNAAWFVANLSALQRQADLWDSRGRPDGLLLRDAALIEAESWAAEHADELTAVERDFLERCRQVREIIRRARRTNRLIRALAVAASVALIVAIFLYVQTNQRYRQSLARLLVVQAGTTVSGPGSLALALLLSHAANDLVDSLETRGALLSSLSASPHLAAYLRGRPNASEVRSVAFSPDGKLLAAAGCGQTDAQVTRCLQGEVQLWDVAARQLSGRPLVAQPDMYSVAFSPDGKLLASGGEDGGVILWDAAARQPVGKLSGHPGIVWSVAFSPDGKLLATAGCAQDDRTADCAHGEIRLWDVATRQQLGALAAHHDAAYTVAFSPDGKLLASGGDPTVILWDVATRRQIGVLAGRGEIGTVAFTPDGRTLASAGRAGAIFLWDVATRKQRGEPLKGHVHAINSVAFSPDGKTLASASADSTVRLWDIATRTEREVLLGQSNEIWSVAFNRDGRTLASSSYAVVTLWDLGARQRLGETITEPDAQPLISAARSPDGRLLTSVGCAETDLVEQTGGCLRGTVRLWDLAARQPRGAPLNGAADAAQVVGFSPDGKTLAAAGCAQADRAAACTQGAIRLWDVASRQPAGPALRGHQATVTSLAFSPDGKLLAAGSADRSMILWDAATRQQVGTLSGHQGIVRSLAFSPDGKLLAAAGCAQDDRTADCAHGEIRLWDVAARQLSGQPLPARSDTPRSMAFSPDGKLLAATDDRSVILWDVAERSELARSQEGHTNKVIAVTFSPDGKTLASASADNTIALWDWDAGERKLQRIGALIGHTDTVMSVAFGPDGATLASASLDGTIVLWDTDVESWRARACTLAGRNLDAEEWEKYLPGIPYRKTCPALPDVP